MATPDGPDDVAVLNDPGEGSGPPASNSRLRRTRRRRSRSKIEATDEPEGDADIDRDPPSAIHAICRPSVRRTAGSNNLVFGGSRRTVETLADALRSKSERAGVPNEFYPHHGNLSKELREELEKRLKTGDLPTTAVCTTTLELGIDIGSVKSIGQIGAPRVPSPRCVSVWAERAAARVSLRYFVSTSSSPSATQNATCWTNFDSTSCARSRRSDCSPVGSSSRRRRATRLRPPCFTRRCQSSQNAAERRPTRSSDSSADLARSPRLHPRITSTCFGTRHPPNFRSSSRRPTGLSCSESRANKSSWREISTPCSKGSRNGVWPRFQDARNDSALQPRRQGKPRRIRRQAMEIIAIDEKSHVLEVAPHKGGQIPVFEGASVEETHDALLLEMRRVYELDDVPAYLDEPAKVLLLQARDAYRRADLAHVNVLDTGSAVHLFPWVGSAATSVIAVALATLGVRAEANDLSVFLPGVGMDEAGRALAKLSACTSEDSTADRRECARPLQRQVRRVRTGASFASALGAAERPGHCGNSGNREAAGNKQHRALGARPSSPTLHKPSRSTFSCCRMRPILFVRSLPKRPC